MSTPKKKLTQDQINKLNQQNKQFIQLLQKIANEAIAQLNSDDYNNKSFKEQREIMAKYHTLDQHIRNEMIKNESKVDKPTVQKNKIHKPHQTKETKNRYNHCTN